MIQNYEDLVVYQKSYQLALKIYEQSRTMPKDEMFGLISQIKRAATSIPLNIAEGYGKRDHVSEFKRFLTMAKGSCDEMKVLIDLCKDIGYMQPDLHDELKAGYNEIGKMLYGLLQNWQ